MTVLLTVNPDEDDDHAWMVDDDVRDNPDDEDHKGPAPGEVTKKLDEGMYEVIERARNGDDAALVQVKKRYGDFAKRYATKYLKEHGVGPTDGGISLANEAADDAMERVLFGKERGDGSRGPSVISRWLPGKTTMATMVAATVKNVLREMSRTTARELRPEVYYQKKLARTKRQKQAQEDKAEIERLAGEMDDVTAAQTQSLIDSGNLDYDDEQRAKRILKAYDRMRAPARDEGRAADEREAIDIAIDNARDDGDGLTKDEATILGLRESGMSYKKIAKELFGTDDKKAVQKTMVRLHRARKSLERTTGMPLRGIEADLGGIGYTKKGRPRKNPELVIYFEDVTDLEELLECGLLDPEGYQACLASLLQCLEM